ncbi:MAG: two-component regulator propeller domain-containing protein [Kofleriaceae bacterium]
MRLACWAVVVTLGVVAGGTVAAAKPSQHGLVRFRSFGSTEGLRNLVVISLAQDTSGQLWVGTDDGLYRYDGERFTHISVDQGLTSSMILIVARAPTGEICAGSTNGLVCWDGERFSRTRAAGLPEVAVQSLVTFQDQLFAGTDAGLFVRDDQGVFTRAPGWRGTTTIKTLWADATGLVVGDGGTVSVSAGDGVWRELSQIGLAGDRIDSLLRDRSGALWIRSALHMWRLPAGADRVEDLTAGLPSAYDSVGVAASMVNGPRGEVWVGTDVGLAYREDGAWKLVDGGGMPSPGARTMFVDREGTMWVGSIGLFQWRGRSLIERFDLGNGLPGDVAWTFGRDREGTLWIGTNRCLARSIDGRWTCLPGTENRVVRSFVFPPQGGVFLGGAPSDLLYIDTAGVSHSLGQELGRPADHAILGLALGPEGDLWVATKVGLFRLRGAVPGPLERVVTAGIPADVRYSSLLVDEGRVWTATTHGIVVFDHGTATVLGTAHGFRAAAMRYLARSHAGRLCISYTEAIGVSCFHWDGRTVSAVQHLGIADGLSTGMVYFLGEDRRHNLWVGTGDGLDVFSARGAEHFADRDGLAGNDAAATAFFEDIDGSLWLGSTGGVSHVDAVHYEGPLAPPHTEVRSGRLGDHAIHATNVALETPHDLNALTIEYGAGSLIDADRIEYQVRLSPLEDEWSTTHLRQARYPALLPGTYRFEVRARIDKGAWGAITELPFEVTPAWWQSLAFAIGVGIAVLLTIGGAFTWRQRAILGRRTRQLNQQSDASLRALLEFIPDLITVNRDGKTIYCNRAMRRLHGIAEGEPPDLSDRVHPDDLAGVVAMIERARGADAHAPPEMIELRVRAGDDSWRTCELSGVWMEIGGSTVLVTTGRDVTERHRLRAKLLISDRMASLGTLAAGIAHEINNPLAYVIGNLEVMSETLAGAVDQDELATAMAGATDGAERVRKIVQGLRSFSRSETERRVLLDVPEILQAAIRLTANEVRHRAQLVCELGVIPKIVADDGRLTQVFINLIINAAHAIPEGRTDANCITVRTRTDDRGRAVIEIIDTGEGMPADVQARAFDPFFTTKHVGEGTGLGLSICHGIISGLDGQISIDSALGRGTTMRVVLPAAVAAIGRVTASMPHQAAPAMRHRVLVVDDEQLVADMLGRVLRRDHDVTVVTCGQAALDLIAGGAWFDAIVSDVMMPNMTGIELLEEIVKLAPVLARRVIFLSGGVFTPQTRARLDELGTLQLEKPVNSKDLRSWVNRVATEGAHSVESRALTTASRST